MNEKQCFRINALGVALVFLSAYTMPPIITIVVIFIAIIVFFYCFILGIRMTIKRLQKTFSKKDSSEEN